MSDFRCQRCGACCRRPGPVAVTAADVERLAPYLDLSVHEFTALYTRLSADRAGLWLTERPDRACVFLEPDGGCRVHAVKPRQCVEFPFGWRYLDTAAVCPAWRAMGDGEAVA
jgi:Fe-S-cluster containining protein